VFDSNFKSLTACAARILFSNSVLASFSSMLKTNNRMPSLISRASNSLAHFPIRKQFCSCNPPSSQESSFPSGLYLLPNDYIQTVVTYLPLTVLATWNASSLACLMAHGPCRIDVATLDHLNGEVSGHPHVYPEDHGLEEGVLDNQDDPKAVLGSQDGPEVVLECREALDDLAAEVLVCLAAVVPDDLVVAVLCDLEADRGRRGDLEEVLCNQDDLEEGLGSLNDLEVDRGSQEVVVVHDDLGGQEVHRGNWHDLEADLCDQMDALVGRGDDLSVPGLAVLLLDRHSKTSLDEVDGPLLLVHCFSTIFVMMIPLARPSSIVPFDSFAHPVLDRQSPTMRVATRACQVENLPGRLEPLVGPQ
jgi:hypothetical protein